MLYDVSSARMLIGLVLNNPTILYNGRYKLNRSDFSPNLFHKTLFAIIERLAETGMEEIDEKAVCTFIESTDKYAVQREVLEDNEYIAFIKSIKEVVRTSDETIDYYYNNVRKFSLLRDYKDNGIDIASVYDELGNEDEQRRKLNDLDISDIIDTFDDKIARIRKEYSIDGAIEESWVGDNLQELLDFFKEKPMFGAMFNSPYLTTIATGWQRGHLILRSAESGFGKTVQSISDLCYVSMKKLWSEKEQRFIDNQNYQGKGFFIHTEMKQWEEIMPRFIAYSADVPYHKIRTMSCTKEEEERLRLALDIFNEERTIKLINLSNFTMKSIRDICKECAVRDGCAYGVFDYIFDNTLCMQEYRKQVGNSARQDSMFLAVATELKAIAEEYNIGIMSMTQLNGKQKTYDMLDERCIFGSTQMKNKIDVGCICTKPSKKELAEIEPLILTDDIPNCITTVYKGRFNKYNQNIKIWQIYDGSTGRIKDLFCTNVDNEPLNVERTVINTAIGREVNVK